MSAKGNHEQELLASVIKGIRSNFSSLVLLLLSFVILVCIISSLEILFFSINLAKRKRKRKSFSHERVRKGRELYFEIKIIIIST